METERTDAMPLMLTQMQRMQVAALWDKHVPTHGLRKGRRVGDVTLVWLVQVLSLADHRMNRVPDWASRRLSTLHGCGWERRTPLDRTDDRWADVLRLISDEKRDRAGEPEGIGQVLQVSALDARGVRLDTTTVSSSADVTEEGVLPWGHCKDHRPDLPHVNIALAPLDPFGVPLGRRGAFWGTGR